MNGKYSNIIILGGDIMTLNNANIGDEFLIKGFTLNEETVILLQNLGIEIGTILVIKKVTPYLDKPCLIVNANGLNITLNSNYINNIYGEVLEKGKQFVKTR